MLCFFTGYGFKDCAKFVLLLFLFIAPNLPMVSFGYTLFSHNYCVLQGFYVDCAQQMYFFYRFQGGLLSFNCFCDVGCFD